jgi:FKBP-type peptidyl-prolyl cis-trans isomerase
LKSEKVKGGLRRKAIAGVEYGLLGMKAGGYRKVRTSPHLAYRDKGIPDLIPPDEVLICEIWLRGLLQECTVHAP